MNKKEIIITTARNLFATYGYKKVSMDEIAKTAAVTKKTIYHYFKDKEELFRLFVMEELDKLKESLEKIDKKDISFLDKVSLYLKKILDFRKKSSLIVMLNKDKSLQTNSPDFLGMYDQAIIQYLEQKIEREIASGNIKKCNVHLTAFLIYKIFFAVMIEYDQEIEEDKVIQEVTSILKDGLLRTGGNNEK